MHSRVKSGTLHHPLTIQTRNSYTNQKVDQNMLTPSKPFNRGGIFGLFSNGGEGCDDDDQHEDTTPLRHKLLQKLLSPLSRNPKEELDATSKREFNTFNNNIGH